MPMKLYHKKYFDQQENAEDKIAEEEMPVNKTSVEYIINQAVIWIAIAFLAIILIKKFI